MLEIYLENAIAQIQIREVDPILITKICDLYNIYDF